MHSLSLLALTGVAAAQIRGFNYGALYANNQARQQADWEADFRAAQELPGVGGFTSARLFTMIQGNSDNAIISALPAAISTNTSLLLGLWCSAGDAAFQSELSVLRNAINQYGSQLQDLIVGISIGSEDLYRISPTGIENESGPGADPQQLVSYISQARDVLRGTVWADKTIGHVDTWTAYVNSSNNPVIEALDWLGVDAYPYYQTTDQNTIDNAESLFFSAYDATVGAAGGKPVWVTETGWPVTGPNSGLASSGTGPAETYWKNVACQLFGGDRSVNTWWYQLNDGGDQEVSFRVIPADRGAPLYDLSCPAGEATTTSAAASTTTTSLITISSTATPSSDAPITDLTSTDDPVSTVFSGTVITVTASPSASGTQASVPTDTATSDIAANSTATAIPNPTPVGPDNSQSSNSITPTGSPTESSSSDTSSPVLPTGAAARTAANAAVGLLLMVGAAACAF